MIWESCLWVQNLGRVQALAFQEARRIAGLAAGLAHEETARRRDAVDDRQTNTAKLTDRLDIVRKQAVEEVGARCQRGTVEFAPVFIASQRRDRPDIQSDPPGLAADFCQRGRIANAQIEALTGQRVNAARGIHPLAGQGFNLGIRDAAALAEVCGEARRVGLDIGAVTTLRRYEDWRKFDSATLAAGTDFFNRLFSNDIEPIRQLRGIGLSIVDSIPPARRFFMRQAGGETGDPPRLLKGQRLDAA